MLNFVIEKVFVKWENDRKIELTHWCQCLQEVKRNLEDAENKYDSFLKNLDKKLLEKIIKLVQQNQNDKTDDRKIYFFLILVTFILDTEQIFMNSVPTALKNSEYFQNELDSFQSGEKREHPKETKEETEMEMEMEMKTKTKTQWNNQKSETTGVDGDNQDAVIIPTTHSNKNHMNNNRFHDSKKVKKKDKKKNKSVNEQGQGYKNSCNYFDAVDTLIKNVLDLRINEKEKDKFINYQICCFYSISKFLFSLFSNGEKFVKMYLKYMKNISSFLLNVNLSVLYDAHITAFIYRVFFFFIHINVHSVKDLEKGFFKFLFLMMNTLDAPVQIIGQILILYLKKRTSIELNAETYQEVYTYANTNLEMFLKYSKKENLFSFINALDIYAQMIQNNLGNNDYNIIFTKNTNYENTDLNIKNWVANINKLLDRMGKIAKEHLTNEKQLDLSLTGDNHIYLQHQKKKTIEINDILDYLKQMKNQKGMEQNQDWVHLDRRTIWNEPIFNKSYSTSVFINAEKQNGGSSSSSSSTNNINGCVMNNLFAYVTKHVFDFFRTVIVKLTSENLSVCANSFTSFIKNFFLFNNEKDFFLAFFLSDFLVKYSEELTKKSFPIFGNLLQLSSHFFLLANELIMLKWNWQGQEVETKQLYKQESEQTEKKEPKKTAGTKENEKTSEHIDSHTHVHHTLHKISEITNNNVTCIYNELYTNIAMMLLFFLKHVKNHAKEVMNEQLMSHYKPFISYVFEDMANPNFERIFQNHMPCYITLQILYRYIKTTNLKYSNLHKIHCTLNQLQQKLNMKEPDCAFFYRNKILNNIHFIQKIKMYLMKNVDAISSDIITSIYQKRKEEDLKKRHIFGDQTKRDYQNEMNKRRKMGNILDELQREGIDSVEEEMHVKKIKKMGEQKQSTNYTQRKYKKSLIDKKNEKTEDSEETDGAEAECRSNEGTSDIQSTQSSSEQINDSSSEQTEEEEEEEVDEHEGEGDDEEKDDEEEEEEEVDEHEGEGDDEEKDDEAEEEEEEEDGDEHEGEDDDEEKDDEEEDVEEEEKNDEDDNDENENNEVGGKENKPIYKAKRSNGTNDSLMKPNAVMSFQRKVDADLKKNKKSLIKKKPTKANAKTEAATIKSKEITKLVKKGKKTFYKNINHIENVTQEEVFDTIRRMKESIQKES